MYRIRKKRKEQEELQWRMDKYLGLEKQYLNIVRCAELAGKGDQKLVDRLYSALEEQYYELTTGEQETILLPYSYVCLSPDTNVYSKQELTKINPDMILLAALTCKEVSTENNSFEEEIRKIQRSLEL